VLETEFVLAAVVLVHVSRISGKVTNKAGPAGQVATEGSSSLRLCANHGELGASRLIVAHPRQPQWFEVKHVPGVFLC